MQEGDQALTFKNVNVLHESKVEDTINLCLKNISSMIIFLNC